MTWHLPVEINICISSVFHFEKFRANTADFSGKDSGRRKLTSASDKTIQVHVKPRASIHDKLLQKLNLLIESPSAWIVLWKSPIFSWECVIYRGGYVINTLLGESVQDIKKMYKDGALIECWTSETCPSLNESAGVVLVLKKPRPPIGSCIWCLLIDPSCWIVSLETRWSSLHTVTFM